jgi:hypothetical protein
VQTVLLASLLGAAQTGIHAQTIATTKKAVDPATNLPVTNIKPGDTVKYVIDYKYVPSATVSGVTDTVLTDTMEGQTFVPGILSSNGWNPLNTAVFVNSTANFKLGTFTSTGTLGVLSAESKLNPPSKVIETGARGGDGYTPILYGGKVKFTKTYLAQHSGTSLRACAFFYEKSLASNRSALMMQQGYAAHSLL